MLQIRTFGGLHISFGEKMTLVTGRHTKMWELLKYLLTCYPNPVTIEKLSEVVFHDDDAKDPAKNIRDIIYRLRKMLAQHGGDQDYIFFTNGSYLWNEAAECFIDFVEFNKFLREAEALGKSDAERIFSYNAAIDLYRGDFMGEKWLIMETWASNFAVFYKRLFLQAVDSLADLYEKQLDYERVISLYNKAILVEPYEESLYTNQIQSLIKNGEYALAKRQYLKIEKFFLKEFNIAPSQTLQLLHEEAIKADIRKPTALAKIKERFDETAAHTGPILCAPETFRQIYRFGRRTKERVKFPVFLGKMTISSDDEIHLTKADYEKAMKTIQSILLKNLRKGDIVCRFSPNQYLLMLTAQKSSDLREGFRMRIGRILEKHARDPNWSRFRLETEIVGIMDAEE